MKFNTRSVPNCRTAIELQRFTRTEIPMRAVFLSLVLLAACGEDAPAPATPAEPAPAPVPAGPDASALASQANAIFKPLPEWMGDKPSDEMVALGRQLYYEKRLSKNHDISCNSCHQLDNFGQDGEPTSPGHKGQRGGRNSPTSLNAALHIAQFWDGRAEDVEAQAKGPILNPIEMAIADEATAVAVIESIPGYSPMFEAAFGDAGVTYDRIADAIGAFERGLVTPSPVDAFLKGDASALNAEQLAGMKTYMDVGCTSCHNGVGVGGAGYFKLGMVQPYETKDLGRFDLTQQESDKYVFKAPSLRNVTRTGPYLHDGSITDLGEMVRIMGRHQLGKELDDAQVKGIVTFLGALEGTVDAAYVKEPEALAAGPKTPSPDPS